MVFGRTGGFPRWCSIPVGGIGWILAVVVAVRAGVVEPPKTRLPAVRGEDQREQAFELRQPPGHPHLVFLASRDSEKQLGDWPERAARRFGAAVTIVGAADLRGVPRWLRAGIRRRLRRHPNPVLLDWDGVLASWAGAGPDRAVVVGVDADGRARGALAGPWTPAEFDRLCSMLGVD